MSGYTFVLCIIAMGIGIPVIGGLVFDYHKRKLALRERELEVLGSHTAEKAAQYAAHTERLEERVRVLERLATDKGASLSDEIEGLRDQPAIGNLRAD
ncbi:MAG: hypothetical protein J7494_00990 [Sphingobium sp.]|nr:hypothetical protein [Sphingobium sp.]